MKAHQVSRLRKHREQERVCVQCVCVRKGEGCGWDGSIGKYLNQGRRPHISQRHLALRSTDTKLLIHTPYEYLLSTPYLLIFCSWSSAKLHLNNTEPQFTCSNLRSVSHPWQGVDSTPYGG
jgi:hypothetical protein